MRYWLNEETDQSTSTSNVQRYGQSIWWNQGYGLIENHAMVDGNKRLGVHVMLVFLALNGIMLTYTQEELYTIVLQIASGDKSRSDLLTWIKNHEDNN